jgi:hypothetical protein
MSVGPDQPQAGPRARSVHCKDYHRPKTGGNPGSVRNRYQRKSTGPSWAMDHDLQRRIIAEALEDTGRAKDSLGRPKTIWNAVEGTVFVGVSCNLSEPIYNCYPEVPPDGGLFEELQRRAERTRDQVPRLALGR